MFEWGDFLFAEGGASSDRAMAEVLQPPAAAQFVRISSAGAGGVDRGGVGMVIFPSPAGGSIKPAAAGVQALTMNSPGSAWTPVLAGLRQLICRRRENPKPKPTSYTLYRTGTKYRSGHILIVYFRPGSPPVRDYRLRSSARRIPVA